MAHPLRVRPLLDDSGRNFGSFACVLSRLIRPRVCSYAQAPQNASIEHARGGAVGYTSSYDSKSRTLGQWRVVRDTRSCCLVWAWHSARKGTAAQPGRTGILSLSAAEHG